MTDSAPFESIASLLERNIGIRHVYGEPIQRGERTVVPVAKVAFGFGGGGGRGRRKGEPGQGVGSAVEEPEGAGGGGGVRMSPVGYLEITSAGTRFVSFNPLLPLALAGGIGAVVGWVCARRTSRF